MHLGKLEGVAWLQATVSPPHQPPRSALPRTAWTLPRSGRPTQLPPRIHALAGPDMKVGLRGLKRSACGTGLLWRSQQAGGPTPYVQRDYKRSLWAGQGQPTPHVQHDCCGGHNRQGNSRQGNNRPHHNRPTPHGTQNIRVCLHRDVLLTSCPPAQLHFEFE